MPIPKKVTDESIREIRALAASGESDESIAECYGVHPGYVRCVRSGRSRKRAGGPVTKKSMTSSALARRVAGLERTVAKLEKKLDALGACLEACGGRID